MAAIEPRGPWPGLVGEYGQNTRHSQRRRGIECRDPTLGDRARHDMAMRQIRGRELGCVLRSSGDLGGSIDPAARGPDVSLGIRHGMCPY